MRGILSTDPYYLSISGPALVNGFRIYFDILFRTNFPWPIWSMVFGTALLVFLLLRSRLALFFQLYSFITFLPVIFLVNHRYAFYWYLPFLCISGLAAMFAKNIVGLVKVRNPGGLAQAGLYTAFALLCWGTFLLHKESNRPQRSEIKIRANEDRAFITGLRALPPRPPEETIFSIRVPHTLMRVICFRQLRWLFGAPMFTQN